MTIAALKRRELFVLVMCFIALFGLLMPAMLTSQRAAERAQSQNNLRQLALAVSNYNDAFKRLPAGAIRHNSEPVLGWLVSIHPYMEASNWYSTIDQSLPYDHPAAYFRYLRPFPSVQHPGASEKFTQDGFPTIHYMANPNLLSLRPHVRMSELTAGASYTWLFGEASGNYQPMAYAYNWRQLNWPVLHGPSSFGVNRTAQFAMVDGTVQTFSQMMDRQIIEQLAAAPPLADPVDTLRPHRTFLLTDYRGMRRRIHIGAVTRLPMKGGCDSEIIFAADGKNAEYAQVLSVNEYIKSTELDLQTLVNRYPTIKVIDLTEMDDRSVEQLTKLPQLKTILCPIPELSDRGWTQLKSLRNLKLISIQSATFLNNSPAGQSSSLHRLRVELPDVAIHLRTR